MLRIDFNQKILDSWGKAMPKNDKLNITDANTLYLKDLLKHLLALPVDGETEKSKLVKYALLQKINVLGEVGVTDDENEIIRKACSILSTEFYCFIYNIFGWTTEKEVEKECE